MSSNFSILRENGLSASPVRVTPSLSFLPCDRPPTSITLALSVFSPGPAGPPTQLTMKLTRKTSISAMNRATPAAASMTYFNRSDMGGASSKRRETLPASSFAGDADDLAVADGTASFLRLRRRRGFGRRGRYGDRRCRRCDRDRLRRDRRGSGD